MAIDFSKIFEKLKSPNAQFVYAILKNWYLLAAIPAMTITYNVLYGLSYNGPDPEKTEGSTLDKIYKEVDDVLKMIEDLSTKCPALIEDLDKFFECIGI